MVLDDLRTELEADFVAEPSLLASSRDLPITGITSDSRSVEPGNVFVAISGTSFDGHLAIEDAVERGAVAVVVQKPLTVDPGVPVFTVRDTRLAVSKLVVRFYGNPSSQLRVYGVTGTNGKTTCATLLEQIFTAAGRNVGFIGTTGNRYNGVHYDTNYSTPHAGELSQLFTQMHSANVDTVCMEVSSHALDQRRVYGIQYRGAIFTNLTRDHLDYHGSMEKYARAKKMLFDGLHPESIAVLWGESEWASYMKRDCPARCAITVGPSPVNHVQITDIELDAQGSTFTLVRRSSDAHLLPPSLKIRTKLLGEFNVANAALVVVLSVLDGIPVEQVVSSMEQVTGPKGRMEVHTTSRGTTAIVDYAHTPDAMENVLTVIRGFLKNSNSSRSIHVVFGCGGNRDKGKRPEMGRIAATLADRVYITSDNPRAERPVDIVNNIMGGIDGPLRSKVSIIDDRRDAITTALSQAGPNDIVVVAGKGHEEYQIIGSQRLPFSDADVIAAWQP